MLTNVLTAKLTTLTTHHQELEVTHFIQPEKPNIVRCKISNGESVVLQTVFSKALFLHLYNPFSVHAV